MYPWLGEKRLPFGQGFFFFFFFFFLLVLRIVLPLAGFLAKAYM